MADEFHRSMRGTIERCRRLAARTHDHVAAERLRTLAVEMEAKLGEMSAREANPGDAARSGDV